MQSEHRPSRVWLLWLIAFSFSLALPVAAQKNSRPTAETLAVLPVLATYKSLQGTEYAHAAKQVNAQIVFIPELQQALRTAIADKSPTIKIVMPEFDTYLLRQIARSQNGTVDPKYAIHFGKLHAARYVVMATLKIMAKSGSNDASDILDKIKDAKGMKDPGIIKTLFHKGSTYYVAEADGYAVDSETGEQVTSAEGAGIGKAPDGAYRNAIENLGEKLARSLSEISKILRVNDKASPATLIMERKRESTKEGDVYQIGTVDEVKDAGKVVYAKFERVALAKVTEVDPKAVILQVTWTESGQKITRAMSAQWLPHGAKPPVEKTEPIPTPLPAKQGHGSKTKTPQQSQQSAPLADTGSNNNTGTGGDDTKTGGNGSGNNTGGNTDSSDQPDKTTSHESPGAKGSQIAVEVNAYNGSKTWAVIVGLNYHNEANIPHLNYTLGDAKLVRELLKLQTNRVRFLSDEPGNPPPTKERIMAAIEEVAGKAGPKDRFWFYFSGHGQDADGKSYLVPCGSSFKGDLGANFVEQNFVSVTEIRQWLQDHCKARGKVLILDACHSGSARALGQPDVTFDFKGICTIAACQVDQTAQEFKEISHGAFTYYLTLGLTGEAATKDKDYHYVFLRDLKDYVTGKVEEECKKHGIAPPQQPSFITPDETPDFVVAKRTPQTDETGKMLRKQYVDNHEDQHKLDETKPLPPALIVVLNNKDEAQYPNDNVEAQVKQILSKNGCPLANPLQVKQFLEVVKGKVDLDNPLTDEQKQHLGVLAHALLSRYLLIGSFHTEPITNTEDGAGLTHLNLVLSVQLMDIEGNVLATIEVEEPGVGNDHSQALKTAMEHLEEELLQQLRDGLTQNSPEALEKLHLEPKENQENPG